MARKMPKQAETFRAKLQEAEQQFLKRGAARTRGRFPASETGAGELARQREVLRIQDTLKDLRYQKQRRLIEGRHKLLRNIT